jgi:hypothetical protein
MRKVKTVKRNLELIPTSKPMSKRVFISVPMTGLLRAEWVMARFGQSIPCNWANTDFIQWLDMVSPYQFLVADARNVAVKAFITGGWEWLWFIDHDVVLPMDTSIKWNYRMLEGKDPIFGGLYFTRSVPSEPLMYREWGASFFADWELGQAVRVKAMGNGNTVMHRSILKAAWDESEEYRIGDQTLRKVFDTPSESYQDPENGLWTKAGGTEDITFFNRCIEDELFAKAGWKKHQRMPYPLLCDTSVFGKHIDWNGVQYPAHGEEKRFLPKKKRGKK